MGACLREPHEPSTFEICRLCMEAGVSPPMKLSFELTEIPTAFGNAAPWPTPR